jgi:hypothetical protein
VFVPVGNVPENLGTELADRVEAGMPQDPPLHADEEQFDLVHPGCVKGRVVDVEPAAMSLVELDPTFAGAIQMNIQVVPNDMDILCGVLLGQLLHKANEVGRLARVGDLGKYMPVLVIERREQAAGAIPLVLVLVATGAAAPGPLRRVLSTQDLHSCLFVHTQDHARWRREVQRATVHRLGAKLGVLAVHPALNPMGPKVGVIENAKDARSADGQLWILRSVCSIQRFERPCLAERDAVELRSAARHRHPRAPGHIVDSPRASAAMLVSQALQPVGDDAVAPQTDRLAVHRQALRHPRNARVLSERPDRPRT